MPQVTFLGPFFIRRSPDGASEDFTRGVTREVTQAWLDQWGGKLPNSHWRVEGANYTSGVELGEIPDSSWKRKQILKWLGNYGIKPQGYATKSTLLELVKTVMDPDSVDEVSEMVAETAEDENNEELEPPPEDKEGE